MAAGQGFASLSKERRRQIAKAGAERARQLGRKHSWTPEEAKAASTKAAEARKVNALKRAISKLLKAGRTKEELMAMSDGDILKAAKAI